MIWLQKYGLYTVAVIGMLVMSACSKDSMTHINYNNVTTGRMDLAGAVSIGLKADDGDTRAIDGYFKSGLYKIDADGNITMVGLFVSVFVTEDEEDDVISEHQEPLRVVPKQVFPASEGFFIASECEYYDKDDDKVNVPYENLLVRKSDGKIWGIDDIISYFISSDGLRTQEGRFKYENGTLYFCSSKYADSQGHVYRFNLDTNIPSFEQITKDRETFADTFHIADDGVVFSWLNTSGQSTSGLNLSWPYAGWQNIEYVQENKRTPEYYHFLNNENEISGIDWEIVIPADLIMNFISDEYKEQYEFLEFRLYIGKCIMEFAAINNRPVAFPIYGDDTYGHCMYVKYHKNGDNTDRYEDLEHFIGKEQYREVEQAAKSYALANGFMPFGYLDINYNETPLSATFGDFHKVQTSFNLNEHDITPESCDVYEGNRYSVVFYNNHYVYRIDHTTGESKFLKTTDTPFGDDSGLTFFYSDKLWNYGRAEGNHISWFDLKSLQEGRIDFTVNVPDYQRYNYKFEDGNLIFEGKNPVTGNTEYLYIDILTGNARTQEVAPGMTFQTLISLN